MSNRKKWAERLQYRFARMRAAVQANAGERVAGVAAVPAVLPWMLRLFGELLRGGASVRATVVALAILLMLALPGTSRAQSGTWSNPASGGLWSDAGNWSAGQVATGSANTAYFNALNITADNTVYVDSSLTIGNLVFGDTVTGSAAGWVLDNNGNTNNVLTLGTSGGTVTVNPLATGKGVIISANVNANGGNITVNGGGTLSLSGVNTGYLYMYGSGNSTVFLNNPAGNTISGNVYVGSAGNYTSGGNVYLGASEQIADTGILYMQANHYSGNGYFSLMGYDETIGGIIRQGGGNGPGATVIQNGAATDSTLTINTVAGQSYSFNYNTAKLYIQNGGAGKLNITKNGLGAQSFNGNLSYTGNTTVNAGTLTIAGCTLNSSPVILNGGIFAIQSSTIGGTITGGSGNVVVLGGANNNIGVGNNANTYSVPTLITGSSTLTQTAANSLPANSVLTIDSGSALVMGNLAGSVKALTGAGTVSLGGAAANLTLSDGANQVHTGVISGTGTISKAGAGQQTLSGPNTFTGNTVVSGGTLVGTTTNALGINSGLKLAGGSFAYQPTAAGSLTLGSGVLNLAAGSRIGTALGGTASQSAITSSGAAVTTGTITVDVYGIPGVPPTAGVNNLITAGSGLNGGTYTLGGIFNLTAFTFSGLTRSDTAISITVFSTTPLTTAYWKGGYSGGNNVWAASDGGSAGNWTTDAGGTAGTPLVPGPGATITFSATGAANQNSMVLGANMSIAGMVVSDTGTINLNADGNGLTLGANGITVNGGAGSVTFGAPITLGSTQGWTNNSANVLTISGTVNNNGTLLTSAGTGTTVISGVLSGSGGVTTGSGTLTLSGTNSFTGTITINGGALLVRNASALGTTTKAMVFNNVAGGVLDITGYDTTVGSFMGGGPLGGNINVGGNTLTTGGLNTSTSFGGALSGTGTLVKNGTGNLMLSGTSAATVLMKVNQGAVVLSNTVGAASCGSLTFDNNLSPDVYTISNNQFVAGAVVTFVTDAGDHGRFELIGTTQTVAGVQMVGYTTQRGVIQNREAGPANSGNSQLILNGSGSYSFGGYLRNSTGTLGVRMDGTGTQTLSGSAINYTGPTLVNNGRLVYLNVGYNSALVTITSPGVLEMNLNALYDNATSTIGGNGTLVKTGTGTMRWGAQVGTIAMSAGALIDIQSGLIDAGSSANDVWANNLSSLNIATGAGIYELSYTAAKFDALTGGGTLSGASSQALTLGANNTAAGTYNAAGIATFSGVIMDVGSLVKSGTGTQVFTGTNTYTSATTISSGVLVVGGAGRLNSGSYAGAIANSGNLVYNSSAPQTLGGIISGGGSLTESGPGNLSLTGVNIYTGPTTINGGTLSIDGAGQLASGNYSGVITNNASLVVNTTAAQTLGGIISGAGPLTKSSTGTLVLTAGNDCSGSITVSGGTLSLSGVNGALTGSSFYTIGGNTILKLDNTSAANNGDRLNNSGTVVMNGGTLNFSNNAGAANYSETAGTLSINAGINTVVASQAAVSQTSAITFAAMTHTPGAVVNFVGIGLGVDNRNRILFTSDPSSILGSWATVNGTDLAVYDATLGIKAATYTDIATLGASVPNSGTLANIRINSLGSGGNDTLTASTTTIGTLLQNWATACTVDTAGANTLQSSSIMIGSGAGSLTIGTAANSGTVMANTAGGALVLNNFAANLLTLNSRIVDNTSASTLNIGGTGTIAIAGGNTYSGGTSLNGGTAVLNNNAALGTGTVTFNNGAAINATTAGITLANNPQVWNGNFSFAGSQGMSLGAGAVTLNATPVVTVTANTLTNAGAISGSGFGLTKAGAGTLLFSGGSANGYTGLTTLNTAHTVLSKSAGVAAIGGNLTIVNASAPDIWMTADNQFASGSVFTFSGGGGNGRFDVFGTSQTLAGLNEANSAGVVQNSEAINGAPSTTSAGTLTLNGAGNYTFNGYLRNSTGTLTVNMNGTGTQTFSLVGSGFRIGGSTAADVAAFNVNSGTVIVPNNCVFNENGGTAGTLTISGGTFSQTGGSFYMPNGTGGPSYLTVNGGAFISAGYLYGQAGVGTVTLSSGTISFAGGLYMGNVGTGVWNQTGGYAYFGTQSNVGQGAATVTLTISGGTFTTANVYTYLSLSSGTVTMNIGGTAFVNLQALRATYANGSKSAINMNGGTLNIATQVANTTCFGYGGPGTCTYNQTAGVTTIGGELRTADNDNGQGTTAILTITGGTFTQNNGYWTYLGVDGTGSSTMSIGGTGYVYLANLQAAQGASSSATISMSGGTLTVGSANAAYLGTGATTTFNWIQSAGAATFQNNLIVANSSGGSTLTISGGTFTQTAGTLTLGNSSGTATWNQSGGVANFSGGGQIYTSWGTGASTLTISGGTFNQNSANWVNIGYGTGLATMNVSGTGHFTTPYLIVARDNATAQGVVNVSGGTMDVGSGGITYIGHVGTATWNQSGGVVNFATTARMAQSANAATLTLSGGTMNGGSGANWFDVGYGTGLATMTVNGGYFGANAFIIARDNGTAQGVVNLNSGTIAIGNNAPTYLGNAGTATWNQTGGVATFAANDVRLANSSAAGTMTISGGSFTQSTGLFYLGVGAGFATMNISGTGFVGLERLHFGNGAAGGIVNLNGGTLRIGASGVTFGSGASTLSFNGGTLMAGADTAFVNSASLAVPINAGGAIFDTQNYTMTFNKPLSAGTGLLTKVGTGTLTLAGTLTFGGNISVNAGTLLPTAINAYPGNIAINGGTLEVGGTAVLGAPYAGLVTNNSAFVFSGSAAQTLSGVISGTGSLTKSGSSTLTLAAGNTYSGATVVSAGLLVITGTNGCSGSVLLSGGTLSLSGVGGVMTNNSLYNIGANSTLLLNNTVAANCTNRLSDTGTVSMNGGTLTIANNAGAANYSENAGTLSIDAGNNTVVSSQAAASQTNVTTFAGLTHAAGTTVNFIGTQLGVDARNQILFVGGSPTLGAWATVNGTNFATYGSFGIVGVSYTDIANSGSIVPNSGTSGNIRINVLGSGGSDTLAAAPTTIGTLLQNYSSACTMDLSGANNTLKTSAIMIASGQGSLTFGTVVNSGTLMANTAGGELVLNNSSANTLTLNSVVADNTSASTVSIAGSGTIVMAGANTYSGGTTLNSGTAVLSNNTAFGTGTLTFKTGSAINATTAGFTLANNPQAWNGNFSFAGSQNLNLGTGTVTLGATPTVTVTANTLTVGGTIAGGFGIIKAGAGTLAFSGVSANTYTDVTTVNAGNLVLTKPDNVTAIGGSITMNNVNSANLWATADGQIASGSVLSFTGASGNARVYLNGKSQTVAGLSEANALAIIENSETGYGPGANANGGTLTLSGSGNYTFNGYLRNGWAAGQGSLTLVANMTGTQTLNLANQSDRFRIGTTDGNNQDLARLIVNSGTVVIPKTYVVFGESGGTTGTITVNGGTLNHTGNGGFYMPNGTGCPSYLNVNGGSVIDAGALYTQAGYGTITLNGGTMSFSGGMNLGNTGTGNWIQTGGYAKFLGESSLAVSGNSSTMTISGGTYDFSQAGQVWFNLGYNAGTATLNISGTGTFKTTRFIVGRANNAGNAFVNMSGGTFTASGATDNHYLGYQDTFTWNHTGGVATFSDYDVRVANIIRDGTITVSGGTFSQTTANWFNLGYGTGLATLNVSGSGNFSASQFLIGRDNATSRGIVNLSGGTITVGAGTTAYIGHTGTATWNQTGGVALFQNNVIVANSANAATVTLSAGTFTESAGQLTIGNSSGTATWNQSGGVASFSGGGEIDLSLGAGASTLALSGGTFTQSSANWVNVGYGAGLASLNVSGTGSFVTPYLAIAKNNLTAQGVVNLSGGTMTIGTGNPCYIGHTGTATWNQTGGVVTFGSNINVAQGTKPATISVSGGTFSQAANTLTLGANSGTATLGISGTGSVSLNQLVLEGGTGLATLNVSGTGNLTTTSLTMAKDNLTAQAVVNLSGGTITIGTGNPCYIGHTGTATWNQTGGVVTFGSNVSVAQNVKPATISVSGGTFSQAANTLTLGVSSGTATFSVSGTGFVSLNQLALGSGATSKSIVNLNGGMLFLGSGGLTLGAGAGTLSFNGGTFQTGANLTLANSANLSTPVGAGGAIFDTQSYTITVNKALTAAGGGPLTKLGTGTLILAGANTYTGATTNSAGTLMVNGSLVAASAVTVNSGTLSGTGTAAGSVLIAPGVTLSPGNPGVAGGVGTLTTGAITVQSGATVAIQMLPTSGDRVASSGAVTLAPGALLTVDGTLNDASSWDILIGTSLTGMFSGLANGDRIPGTQMSIFYRADRVTLQTDNVGTVYMIR